MITSMRSYTVESFNKDFPDDESCMRWIVTNRFPNGIPCEKCGKITEHHYFKDFKTYQCDICGTHLHPTMGTIYHKGGLPIRQWFFLVFLVAENQKITDQEAADELNIPVTHIKPMMEKIKKHLV